ncbi:MAG: alpha-hydroxy-acid oxidizing protein [Alphaproteobacteria bacterium]|nr:alpha-hydroxy-acid oxidizing protein [Alphaproteobacteria bacterium]
MTETTADSGLGGRYATLHEIVRAARNALPTNFWDYLTGAAESETTIRRNRLALDSLGFRPRVLRDVSRVDATAQVFGKPARLPVVLAPIGSIENLNAEGTAAVARAAAAFGVPMVVSSVAKPGLEATAKAAPACRRIFQLYVRGDMEWVDDYGRRSIDNGYEAFCFTVDTALYSRRERDIAKRYVIGGRGQVVAEMERFQAAFDWDDVARFKARHDIPIILKGIVTAEDAELACQLGAAVVYVSNHGGRQLDHGCGAIDVLPEVAAAVKGRARIVVDGGFCRGSDVVKALALGADAVGIGRLYCYGLAAAGDAGVLRVLELLETEIRMCLGLLGATRYAELKREMVIAAPPVYPPHVLSAFPLLDLSHPGY